MTPKDLQSAIADYLLYRRSWWRGDQDVLILMPCENEHDEYRQFSIQKLSILRETGTLCIVAATCTNDREGGTP